MAEDTDFGALYRELAIDSTCSLAELRGAWRRRVSKLHPDQGGSAEDTGRLQQLNRLYDAALDFHARYQRMPGAMALGPLSPQGLGSAVRSSAFAGDRHANERPASGFGRMPRYFVVVSLVAMAILAWRVVHNETANGRNRAAGTDRDAMLDSIAGSEVLPRTVAKRLPAARAIAPGMGKDTVRNILGEPFDMHALRWSYGPSWVQFRCDKVVGWYSSPLRPLRVSAARDTRVRAVPSDDRACD